MKKSILKNNANMALLAQTICGNQLGHIFPCRMNSDMHSRHDFGKNIKIVGKSSRAHDVATLWRVVEMCFEPCFNDGAWPVCTLYLCLSVTLSKTFDNSISSLFVFQEKCRSKQILNEIIFFRRFSFPFP